ARCGKEPGSRIGVAVIGAVERVDFDLPLRCAGLLRNGMAEAVAGVESRDGVFAVFRRMPGAARETTNW
ncbi:hypothetical protein, partial [Burkholderia sp.]|uniref:hypothetical protein n=1 Tax=Burkholderia sp. TaxID=36773 RepID=UPI00258A8330